MPIIAQREKENADVPPLQIGRNLTLKKLTHNCYWLGLLQVQQGVMPNKKEEMFLQEKPLFFVQGVCWDWQCPVLPVPFWAEQGYLTSPAVRQADEYLLHQQSRKKRI